MLQKNHISHRNSCVLHQGSAQDGGIAPGHKTLEAEAGRPGREMGWALPRGVEDSPSLEVSKGWDLGEAVPAHGRVWN